MNYTFANKSMNTLQSTVKRGNKIRMHNVHKNRISNIDLLLDF